MFEPESIPYALCRELLASGVVGRVAFCTPSGPRIYPVNYSVINESIIFRTARDSTLGTLAPGSDLAFEVDYFDYHYHQAWSVLAVGPAAEIENVADRVAIPKAAVPHPWAAGIREIHVRLVWNELSGRKLGPSWDPRRDLTVRRVRSDAARTPSP